jgi:quercetin dioxygenase-like cupin family protein
MAEHVVSKVTSVGEHPNRPPGSGVAVTAARESLTNIPGKTIVVEVVDVAPGGRVPRHRHGGPTIDYVMAGVLRMQMQGGSAQDYNPGEVLFEPEGAVHLYAENCSPTEPAKIMLICVADDGANLIDYF